jgi:hypothetical protein
MKRILIALLLCYSSCCFAQTLSFSYGIGKWDYIQDKGLQDGPMINERSFNSYGINFKKETAKNLFLGLGINYGNYRYTFINETYIEDFELSTSIQQINLLSFPIQLRYEPNKYIFIDGGAVIDFNLRKRYDYYSGIGVNIGAGLQYYFKNKIGIHINPEANFRSLLSFKENNAFSINDYVVKVGLSYKFK